MANEFDFGFSDFEADIQKFLDDFNNWLHDWIDMKAAEVLATLKRRTPVDTGELQSNWRIRNIEWDSDGVLVTFENTTEYADYVEFGHAWPYHSGASPGDYDWVNGAFMMTITFDELDANLPKELAEAFQTFVNERW